MLFEEAHELFVKDGEVTFLRQVWCNVRDMDRQKYCHELNRETFLSAMGYQVISFAYADVEQRPELCISLCGWC